MTDFTIDELNAAHRAISSSVRKIEKVRQTLLERQPAPKAQLTLASRNLTAFRLALELIEREKERVKE